MDVNDAVDVVDSETVLVTVGYSCSGSVFQLPAEKVNLRSWLHHGTAEWCGAACLYGLNSGRLVDPGTAPAAAVTPAAAKSIPDVPI